MNKCLIKGMAICLVGTIQKKTGQLFGNGRMEAAGAHKEVDGRSRIAVGDAQETIKQCLKRQYQSI